MSGFIPAVEVEKVVVVTTLEVTEVEEAEVVVGLEWLEVDTGEVVPETTVENVLPARVVEDELASVGVVPGVTL